MNLLKRLTFGALFVIMVPIIFSCSEPKNNSVSSVTITISVKDEIKVNSVIVPFDSLESHLEKLGVTKETNVSIRPDPEAGAATIERVQRKVRVFKESKR